VIRETSSLLGVENSGSVTLGCCGHPGVSMGVAQLVLARSTGKGEIPWLQKTAFLDSCASELQASMRLQVFLRVFEAGGTVELRELPRD
jgi:hypothetical protein